MSFRCSYGWVGNGLRLIVTAGDIRLLLFPVVLCYSALADSGQGYFIRGKILSEYHEESGAVTKRQVEFEVSADSVLKIIRVYDTSNPSIEYVCSYNDETNTYQLVKFKDPAPNSNGASLDIWPSPVPSPPMGLMSYIWQAYCSGNYYKSLMSNLIDPAGFVSSSFRNQRLKLHGYWLLNDKPPYCPIRVAEVFKGELYIEEQLGQIKSQKLPETAKFLTNTVSQAQSWTNIDGMAFPNRFLVERYSVNPASLSSSIIQRIEGRILEVAVLNRVDPVILPPMTMIYDHRVDMMGKPSAFGYFSQSGHLRTLSEIYTNQEYRSAQFVPATQSNHPRKRATIIAILIVFSLFVLGYLLFKKAPRQ